MSIRTAQRRAKFQDPGHYTQKDRQKIDAADFGDPAGKKFPIVTAKDVIDAAHLIGKASDPEAVKKRIIAIAKRKGFPLPDAWKEEQAPARMQQPARSEQALTTRNSGDALVRMACPSEIRILDAANREIEVCATSEAKDTFQTRFAYEASKDAFERWAGNIREMHAPVAVGRKVDLRFDDENRRVYTRMRISRGAEDTWQKLLDGTLQGASIGASNVIWETRRDAAGGDCKVATQYDLVELSLVDNPSNPDTRGVTFIRMSQPTPLLADGVGEILPAPQNVGVETQAVSVSGMSTDAMAAAINPDGPIAQRMAQARAAAAVRDAGEQAMQSIIQQENEDVSVFIARRAQARGRAEAAELIRQQQQAEETRAKTKSTTVAPKAEPAPKASGSNVFTDSRPSSPIMTVQPQGAGHRVLVNTEDTNAKDFGVPEPDEGRPTPGDEGGEEDEGALTADEEQFHPGGHPKTTHWTDGDYDWDGDHDGEGDGDLPRIASRPPAATMRKPAKSRPGFDDAGGRVAQPSVTREGARISAESMDTIHGLRDGALHTAHDAAMHCSCDECLTHAAHILKLLAGELEDEGEEAEEESEELEAEAEEEGGEEEEERAQIATLTRIIQDAMKPLVSEVRAQSDQQKRFRHAVKRRFEATEQRPTMTRTQKPDETRAMATLLQSAEETRAALANMTDAMTRIDQRLAVVEQQPVMTGGPIGVSEKRLAINPTQQESAQERLAADIKRIAESGNANAQLDAFSQLFGAQGLPPIPQFGGR